MLHCIVLGFRRIKSFDGNQSSLDVVQLADEFLIFGFRAVCLAQSLRKVFD